MIFTLRPAILNDLNTVLTWIHTPQDLMYWGGPKLTYPPNPEKTWGEMGATEQNAFVLIDPPGNVVGFGQTLLQKPETIHLGRIMVAPLLRGERVSHILCEQLIQTAVSQHHPLWITLNVYRDNLPAYRLYQSLGFVVTSENPEHNSCGMCLQLSDRKKE